MFPISLELLSQRTNDTHLDEEKSGEEKNFFKEEKLFSPILILF